MRKIRARRAKASFEGAGGTVPSPGRFPHLSAFLAGYLHQDFTLYHKTPAEALRVFMTDASTEERNALRRDWRLFLDASDGLQWRDLRAAFSRLGGAWQPGSRSALLALFEALKEKR
ncbi:MAG: hypothetical protein FJW27_10020 [Acidimicrobiia bacterium]|nr:hypothetical protein [Acidimicrobiia bacterium]